MDELELKKKKALALARARARQGNPMRDRVRAAKAKVAAGQYPERQSWDEMSEADRQAIYNMSGGKLRANLLGDVDPTTINPGEKAGTALNKAGESMTLGVIGDEASAAFESIAPGVDYDTRRDHYRQQERILEQDNPGTALGAELGGAVASVVVPGALVGTLSRGAGLVPRVLASTGAGAGMGGTYGFMEGEGANDRLDAAKTGAALGGAVGSAVPVVGAGVQKVADAIKGNRAVKAIAKNAPGTEDLRALGRRLYQQVDDAGVQIKPESFNRTRKGITDALRTRTGFDELPGPGSLTPKTARVSQIMAKASDEMAQEPTAALPFSSLDQMRRQAGAAAGDVANRTDQQAGMTVIEGLDDFVRTLGPDDVAAGDVEALKTAIPKARDVWSRMTRSQLLDDAIDQSDNYHSGGASAIRNQFASILRNPKISRNFSDAEKKVLQKVVSGSLPQQMLNYLGSGLGMMGQMGLGAATGGFPGFLAGAGGAAASRKGAEALTRRQAEIARALVAGGGMKTLPVATDQSRRIAEALMRRAAAVGAQ